MITTRFNTNILTAARKLQASRTVATAAGDASQRLTSARLADYENTAIRRILLEEYSSLGIPGFVATLPWYVRTSPEVIVTGQPTDLPADGWMVESVVAVLLCHVGAASALPALVGSVESACLASSPGPGLAGDRDQ